jgi:hypothetical protein
MLADTVEEHGVKQISIFSGIGKRVFRAVFFRVLPGK